MYEAFRQLAQKLIPRISNAGTLPAAGAGALPADSERLRQHYPGDGVHPPADGTPSARMAALSQELRGSDVCSDAPWACASFCEH